MSITWFTHQNCEDMFILSKWNQSKTYNFEIKRDFGTDYGICCWYTPQLNFTEIDQHTKDNNLHEADWGHWFMNVPKVPPVHSQGFAHSCCHYKLASQPQLCACRAQKCSAGCAQCHFSFAWSIAYSTTCTLPRAPKLARTTATQCSLT